MYFVKKANALTYWHSDINCQHLFDSKHTYLYQQ